ncbi:hypothetical protein CA606_19810 [Caulobacter vibrioides]|uniref:Uncharacterized protein n=2 Tax=Caulobacter vibrioides TaxID=155892 RepID=A0A290MQS1_CAUVI|nr:hypothetical protein CA606_19810 [Caulobacter vibrioides]
MVASVANAATPAKPKALSGPAPAITELFVADMLGADRAFVERRIGPAKYVNDGERKYVVAGCNVTINYKGNAVRNMAIDGLSNRCTFNVAKFYPQERLTDAASLTFGGFDKMFRNTVYFPQCFGTCGNSANPSLTAHYDGSHAEQFVEIQVSNSYPYRGAAADKAFRKVMDAITSTPSNIDDNADCSVAVSAIAQTYFTGVQINNIVVGYDLDTNPARCGR